VDVTPDRSSLDELPRFDPHGLGMENRLGHHVQIFAHRVRIGPRATIEDNVVLAGDEIVIGENTRIARDSDIRASRIFIGPESEVQQGVRILVAETFSVGAAARLATGVRIVCRDFTAGRLLYLGDQLSVGYGGTTTSTSTVQIGDRVTIGQHTILNANYPIAIGDNVGTGSYLAIWTHGYHFGHGPLDGYAPAYAPVRIERNVWLGFHVTILPGITIGENSIVAAGSIVTSSMPAQSLIAGVPASVRRALTGKRADEPVGRTVVRDVLHVWQRELEWKGCRVIRSRLDQLQPEITVTREDGSERTRVVALGTDDPAPIPAAGESLALLVFGDRSDVEALLAAGGAVLELRGGRQHGPRWSLLEDLRDQFRRYGMPCGDDHCFFAIEPAAFARLRRAGHMS
jgi:acetyltransferase-like isoleucine patch superfamily enzyme